MLKPNGKECVGNDFVSRKGFLGKRRTTTCCFLDDISNESFNDRCIFQSVTEAYL